LGNDRQLHSRLSLKNLQQTFTSIREIIISNKKDFFLSIFDFHNKKNLNSSFKSNFIYSIPRSIIEISIVLLISVIIIYLKNSNISFSEIILTLTIFVVGAARLMPSISAIFSNLSSLVYYNNATNIFSNEFFNFIKKKKFLISEKQINFRIIKYKNISFNYPGKKKKIISNLNFEFKFNDKVGIIGDTGSGKSTLVNIISGLLKSTNGEIFIDGLKVNNLNEQWFNTISYVPQNVLTLDENFKNNIILGAKKINHQHFNKITKILDLNEIKKKYLNTRTIGERGSRISGGQNQRIGLARAFYKNSKILILDESLSSIHIKLRDRILKNIFEMYKNKLVILVSHQLDALKKFDKILKIEKGKIIRIK
jgi:ABC-type multidrug transport system fused ATPase/permease subunit